jgi:DNA polymerase-1
MATGAFYGFAKAIMQMYQELNPQTIIFATDTKEKTWRHTEYTEYKATRKPPDQAMIDQIPLILEWSKKVTSNVFAVPGYEADDIIGSISKQFLLNQELAKVQKQDTLFSQSREGGFYPKTVHAIDKESLVFSSDKDLYQMFVTDGVKFVKAKNKGDYELYDYPQFKEQYNLLASQWVDAKALVGDNSDNLPGLPGVGPKTAATLLNDFGYLYYVYKALGLDPSPFRRDMIPGEWEKNAESFVNNPKKQKYIDLLRDNYDQVVRIYHLATLSDVPGLRYIMDAPSFGGGLPLLEKYGFKSLITTTKQFQAKEQEPESLF